MRNRSSAAAFHYEHGPGASITAAARCRGQLRSPLSSRQGLADFETALYRGGNGSTLTL